MYGETSRSFNLPGADNPGNALVITYSEFRGLTQWSIFWWSAITDKYYQLFNDDGNIVVNEKRIWMNDNCTCERCTMHD